MKNLLADSVMLAQINLRNVGEDFSPATSLEVPDIISGFVKFILILAGLAFFFILVIGGVKWIMSGGDKAHTEGARNQITAALVGLVIVFSAWAIIQLIQTFFGIDLLELQLPVAGQ